MASIETSAALQRIAARFAERLPERLDGIDRLIALWCSDSSTSQLDEIITTCHDLAGTAPTLGYPDLGVAAQQLEALALDVRRQAAGSSEENISILTGGIRALRDAS